MHYEVVCKGVPFDAVLKVDITLDRFEVEKNVWIDWHYTPECQYPVLEGDPLVHVRFGDGTNSIDGKHGARPISYWHEDGAGINNFKGPNRNPRGGKYAAGAGDIIAYMILNPNDHD